MLLSFGVAASPVPPPLAPRSRSFRRRPASRSRFPRKPPGVWFPLGCLNYTPACSKAGAYHRAAQGSRESAEHPSRPPGIWTFPTSTGPTGRFQRFNPPAAKLGDGLYVGLRGPACGANSVHTVEPRNGSSDCAARGDGSGPRLWKTCGPRR